MTIKNKTIQWYSSNGYLNTGIRPIPGQWYHLAAVRSADVLSIYVNGVKQVNSSCAGKSFNSAGTGLVLGKYYTNWNFLYFDLINT